VVGQLNSQVIASLCMLDYTNTYSALATLWVAMFIEWTGLLHPSYLISMLVSALAGKPVESKEPKRDVGQTLTFFFKCCMSLAGPIFCFAVTLVALFDGKTTMRDGVPPVVAVIIFFILMSVVGMLEGMQMPSSPSPRSLPLNVESPTRQDDVVENAERSFFRLHNIRDRHCHGTVY